MSLRFLLVAVFAFVGAERTFARPDVMAIYYPCWAPTPALESYFGKGWTEWEYIRSAPPRFPGHQQPIIPTCGYLRGDDPRDVEREIDLAADHGIDVFLFDWYYYGGLKLMHETLEKGFLKAKNRDRLKFAIMWCCHEIDNEFRPDPAKPRERMFTLAKTEAGFAMLIDGCMAYFREPNYYRHNGKLYFSIYSPQVMIKEVGVAGFRRALDAARAKVRAAGLGEIEFNVQGGPQNTQEMVDAGFDSLTDYVFCTYNDTVGQRAENGGSWLFDYGSIGARLKAHWAKKANGPLVYNPVVPTGWDPSPRARVDVPFPRPKGRDRYPYGEIYTNATPRAFGRYLEMAKEFVREDPRRSIVQLYAWNEYTEGGWLLPDNFSGDARLKEIKRVMGTAGRASPPLTAKPDFVVEASGAERRLVCNFPKRLKRPLEAKKFGFGDIVCDIRVDETEIRVRSNAAFALLAEDYAYRVKSGENVFKRCRAAYPASAYDSYERPQKVVDILPDECWYGGEMRSASRQPFSAETESEIRDLRYNHGSGIGGNAAAPLLLSSKGRYLWCERPIWYRIERGRISIGSAPAIANTVLGCRNDSDEIVLGTAGSTLREAFLHCSKRYFPPKGHPDLAWFRNPIVNTWASLTYFPTAKGCLELAHGFKDMGMSPGVFMVDHGWHEFSFGSWDFHRGRFPDPKGFVDEIKALGYSNVILWFDCHVTTDSLVFRELRKNRFLQRRTDGFFMPSHWWAGDATVVDCMNPGGYGWTRSQLKRLIADYGVDGFFFDAGDPGNYFDCYKADDPDCQPVYWIDGAVPADCSWAYQHLGTEVPLQQHRALWKHGGYPLKLTECDKPPTFKALHECVADGLVAGLLGYPFVDFDMVGGGLVGGQKDSRVVVNQEQFVRSMQVQCLSPMVQLSIPPWKALDGKYLAAFKAALGIRRKWTPYIVETARKSGEAGEPMMRSMEYSFPGNGYGKVMDQFLMGDRLLVAPQLDEGAAERAVEIPPGTWRADDGTEYVGPRRITVRTPLGRLPHFEKK